MNRFSESQISQFRSRLETLRGQLLQLENQNEQEALKELSPETTDEISHIRTHDADLATDASVQEVDLQLAGGEVREIQDIEDALLKLDAGSYGVCLNCGQDIPDSRLEALPYTKYCSACESKMEKH